MQLSMGRSGERAYACPERAVNTFLVCAHHDLFHPIASITQTLRRARVIDKPPPPAHRPRRAFDRFPCPHYEYCILWSRVFIRVPIFLFFSPFVSPSFFSPSFVDYDFLVTDENHERVFFGGVLMTDVDRHPRIGFILARIFDTSLFGKVYRQALCFDFARTGRSKLLKGASISKLRISQRLSPNSLISLWKKAKTPASRSNGHGIN